MEHSIYSYSLCVALPLMLFFGFYFLFAKTPEKEIFHNYLRSRRIMGLALLLLAANYSVHFFFEVRFINVNAAILMNLSTYFLSYWLFSSSLITLLNRFYITERRLRVHICLWVLYSILSAIVLLLLPEGITQTAGLFVMAVCLIAYGLVLARRVLLYYHRAVKLFDDSHSDDIGAYIRWLSVFTYWALVFGVGCGLLTFLPDEYVYVWILSSVPFYIYLYCSYMNYLLFYEQVERVFEQEMPSANEDSEDADTGFNEDDREIPSCYAEIADKINEWLKIDGYVSSGLTVKELAETLHTNRTYLSGYIKSTYNKSFREWITDLRMEYAKSLFAEFPQLTVADISERTGFQSPSHFIRLFKEREGCSPARWRKMNS